MRYKEYKGADKYYFRMYRTSINHPFIVVAVTEEKKENGRILFSGYMMTTSVLRFIEKPTSYKKLAVNPNPHDDSPSFVNVYRLNDLPANKFSKPYTNWHLSEKDEKLINSFENRYKKK